MGRGGASKGGLGLVTWSMQVMQHTQVIMLNPMQLQRQVTDLASSIGDVTDSGLSQSASQHHPAITHAQTSTNQCLAFETTGASKLRVTYSCRCLSRRPHLLGTHML